MKTNKTTWTRANAAGYRWEIAGLSLTCRAQKRCTHARKHGGEGVHYRYVGPRAEFDTEAARQLFLENWTPESWAGEQV